jgi:hypothetical protein
MKKLKKVLLPVAIILIGTAAAFATNAKKSTGNSLTPGYSFDNSTSKCVQKRTDCSPVGVISCTWTDNYNESHDLYKLNGTSCVQALYEP